MSNGTPRDILIQCQACSIENMFGGYTPEQLIFCNQCRDRLIEPNLKEVCSQFDCQDCGLSILILKKTPFVIGDAICRCGSKNLLRVESITLYDDAVRAGTFDEDDMSSQEGDWYRSEHVNEEAEDYNKLFDDDLGVD